jgi:hypothetical protein
MENSWKSQGYKQKKQYFNVFLEDYKFQSVLEFLIGIVFCLLRRILIYYKNSVRFWRVVKFGYTQTNQKKIFSKMVHKKKQNKCFQINSN